jgi:hypothetical protein
LPWCPWFHSSHMGPRTSACSTNVKPSDMRRGTGDRAPEAIVLGL